MNPDKLFDYLDGKLAVSDREELEGKLRTDSQLQKQFAIAREIHRGMRKGREVMPPPDRTGVPARTTKLGRRVATAAAALVLVNVLIGMAFIARSHQNKPNDVADKEKAMRQQLLLSLNHAAERALPAPSITADTIDIPATPAQREAAAKSVAEAAARCGGSTTNGLPNEKVTTIMVTIPAQRETEFRQALIPLTGMTAPGTPTAATPSSAAPDETRLLQIRIGEITR